MKIIYSAIFRKDNDDPKWWNVYMPDVLGAVTCGDSFENAKYMAKDLLKSLLEISPMQFGFPTPIEETKNNFPNDIVEPIEIDIDIADFEFNKTLTIKEQEPQKFRIGKHNYKIYGSLFDYRNTRIFLLNGQNKIDIEITDYDKKYHLLQYARSISWEKVMMPNNSN